MTDILFAKEIEQITEVIKEHPLSADDIVSIIKSAGILESRGVCVVNLLLQKVEDTDYLEP